MRLKINKSVDTKRTKSYYRSIDRWRYSSSTSQERIIKPNLTFIGHKLLLIFFLIEIMTHNLWVKSWGSFWWFWSTRATSLDVLEVCLFYRCGCARTDASNVRFCNSNSRFNALTDEFYWKSRECDGVKDCANGLDESNCRGGTRAPPTTTRRTTTTRYDSINFGPNTVPNKNQESTHCSVRVGASRFQNFKTRF